MEDHGLRTPDKNTEFGITVVDNVSQFLQGPSIVCDNVTINMADMVGTSPLPSIQSWLYPQSIANGDLSSVVSPVTNVTDALQQITSVLNQSQNAATPNDADRRNSGDSKHDSQHLSVYQLNCNIMGLPIDSDFCKAVDKTNGLSFDILPETKVLTSGQSEEITTVEDKEFQIAPILHTVPLSMDLLRLLRGENISMGDQLTDGNGVNTDQNNNEKNEGTATKPRKKTYKVLTTVATQTMPESDLCNDFKSEVSEYKSPNHYNGKSKLDSCRFLYQFLEAMLSDPRYDNLIKWKNEQERTFTLLDHNKVAHLWGVHKRKKSMTYDKFSRALRFYYSKNILRKENARFTYRFLTKEGSKLPF